MLASDTYFLSTSSKIDNYALFSQLLSTLLSNELVLSGAFKCEINGNKYFKSFGACNHCHFNQLEASVVMKRYRQSHFELVIAEAEMSESEFSQINRELGAVTMIANAWLNYFSKKLHRKIDLMLQIRKGLEVVKPHDERSRGGSKDSSKEGSRACSINLTSTPETPDNQRKVLLREIEDVLASIFSLDVDEVVEILEGIIAQASALLDGRGLVPDGFSIEFGDANGQVSLV